MFNLNGATIDLGGNTIASAVLPVTGTFAAGTLKNLGEFDGGGTVLKTGAGTLFMPTANGYTGLTSINAGILDMGNANSLGGTANGTIVSGTGTLQIDTGTTFPAGESLTLSGNGAGGIGALNALNGNYSVTAAVLTGSTTIGSGTPGDTLTIGTIASTLATNLTFVGAGNTSVTNGFGNSPVVAGELSAQFYQGANAGAIASITPDGKPDDLLTIQTQQAPFAGLGSASNTPLLSPGVNYPDLGGGTASATTDPFFGLTGNTPDGTTNNQAGVWIGQITITDPGFYTFYTGSDDGSNLWLDLNGNGAFSTNGVPDTAVVTDLTGFTTTPALATAASGSLSGGVISGGTQATATLSEQIVSNNNAQGVTGKSSVPILLAAGVYAIRIADNNGTGGLASIASWQETPDPGVSSTAGFAPVTIPASAFTYAPALNVAMNGTGIVRLNGADTYTGTTTVNSGTLEIDGSTSSTMATTVINGALAGTGTIAGQINVGAGGVLSPGQNGGSATGILSTGNVSFASVLPAPSLNIQLNGSVLGTEYDQLNVTGTVSLNGAILNVLVGPNLDLDSVNGTTQFNFINNDSTDIVSGSFSNVSVGTTYTTGGESFVLSTTNVASNSTDGSMNDVGLDKVLSNVFYVSTTFAGDAPGTVVTSATLTNGQTATIYDPVHQTGNAFASLQDAINAYEIGNNLGTATAIIVDPGEFTGVTQLNQPANLILQGGAVVIDSLDGSLATSASINIQPGASLTVDGDGSSTSYVGTISGSGSFFKAGAGTFVLTQVNSFSGPIEVAGTLQVGGGSGASGNATAGTGAVTIDPGATLQISEPSTASAPATIANAIGGAGNLTIQGSTSKGAVVLTGANSYSGILTITGGRFVAASVGAIGNPSSVVVSGGGQFSFGTLNGITMAQTLLLSTTGFTDANGTTGGLLFTGTTNTWAGQISVSGTGRIGAFGATANLPGLITGPGQIDFGAGTATAEKFLITGNSNNVASANLNSSSTVILGTGTTLGSLTNNYTLASTTTAASTAILAFNSSGTTTFSGTIAGGGAVAVQAGGTVTLASGANVTVGTNTNSSSGLFVGDNIGGTAGAGTLNILTGATVTDAAALTVGATSPGTVNQTGGSVTLTSTSGTGTNSNLRIENAAGATVTSTYNLSGGGTLTATSSELILGFDGVGVLNISGASTVAKLLGIRETNNNFSSGTVNVTNSGTLQLGSSGVYSGNVLGTQLLNVGAATIQPFAAGSISVPTELSGAAQFNTTFTYNVTGPVGGAGSITKLGTGNLTLSGNNAFVGGTVINAGTLSSATSSSLGSGAVTEAGGTLSVAGNNTFTQGGAFINGFNGGAGWATNNNGAPTDLASFSGNDLTISQNAVNVNTANSAWFGTKVNATAFTTSFTYTETGGADGFAMVWQNSTGGTAVVGANGGNFGYGGGTAPNNIGTSFALVFNINAGRAGTIAFFENGNVGGFLPLGNGVTLTGGTANPTNIAISYDGAKMTITFTQGANTFTTSVGVNLLGLLGSNLATVGFTAGTGGATKQDITNFIYTASTATPVVGTYPNAVNVAPGATSTTNVLATSLSSAIIMGPLTAGAGSTLNVSGTSVVNGFGGNGTGWVANGTQNGAVSPPTVTADSLTLTTAANTEAKSFWNANPVIVTSFHADYSYTDAGGAASADGAAFVLQNAPTGTTALGTTGGGLGYGGITPSFAVEFNIYAPNVVGYRFATNGATGTPYTAINATNGTVTGTAISLISGSPINVDLVYNGTTLTMTLDDKMGDTYVTTTTVDIPTTVGGSTAIMGFTGGTGGAQQVQTIDTFSYTGGAATPYSGSRSAPPGRLYHEPEWDQHDQRHLQRHAEPRLPQ